MGTYLEAQGPGRNDLFFQVVQALLELAAHGTEEHATLEHIQHHLASQSGAVVPRQRVLLDDG